MHKISIVMHHYEMYQQVKVSKYWNMFDNVQKFHSDASSCDVSSIAQMSNVFLIV